MINFLLPELSRISFNGFTLKQTKLYIAYVMSFPPLKHLKLHSNKKQEAENRLITGKKFSDSLSLAMPNWEKLVGIK